MTNKLTREHLVGKSRPPSAVSDHDMKSLARGEIVARLGDALFKGTDKPPGQAFYHGLSRQGSHRHKRAHTDRSQQRPVAGVASTTFRTENVLFDLHPRRGEVFCPSELLSLETGVRGFLKDKGTMHLYKLCGQWDTIGHHCQSRRGHCNLMVLELLAR